MSFIRLFRPEISVIDLSVYSLVASIAFFVVILPSALLSILLLRFGVGKLIASIVFLLVGFVLSILIFGTPCSGYGSLKRHGFLLVEAGGMTNLGYLICPSYNAFKILLVWFVLFICMPSNRLEKKVE